MEDFKWLEVIDLIIKNGANERPVLYSGEYFDFVIFKNLGTDIGFMTLWNVTSLKAIHISRMKVPNNVKHFDIDEGSLEYDDLVPSNLKFENPFNDVD